MLVTFVVGLSLSRNTQVAGILLSFLARNLTRHNKTIVPRTGSSWLLYLPWKSIGISWLEDTLPYLPIMLPWYTLRPSHHFLDVKLVGWTCSPSLTLILVMWLANPMWLTTFHDFLVHLYLHTTYHQPTHLFLRVSIIAWVFGRLKQFASLML